MQDLIAVECLEARKLEEALINVHTATPRNLVSSITAQLDTPGKAALTASSKALEMSLQRGRDKAQKHPKTPKTFCFILKHLIINNVILINLHFHGSKWALRNQNWRRVENLRLPVSRRARQQVARE